MAVMNARFRFTAAASLGLCVSLVACTVHKTEVPSPSGPSGLADPGITINISPDVLTQDGASQAVVTITATNNFGNPAGNIQLRADVTSGGIVTDAEGTLSAKSLVTDSNGRATVIYTAPPPLGSVVSTGTKNIVDIQVTPLAGDFGNTTPRTASLQLVQPGVIPAPSSTFIPSFTANPAAPSAGDSVVFTATVNDPANGNADVTNQVGSFQWDFGDGGSGSGRTVTHTFSQIRTFNVRLTITDALGRTNSVNQSIVVGQGQLPTAAFVVSPSSASINQTINFNASVSTAAPGHTITNYAWDFGDGSSAGGVTVTHAYTQAGSYTVVLKVTDDANRQATTTQTITVGTGKPTASFTTSPASPVHGTSVQFNGSTSQPATGRTIVSYIWTWGDGTPDGSGPIASHVFALPGSYTVTLTVIDDQGNTSSATQSVSVS